MSASSRWSWRSWRRWFLWGLLVLLLAWMLATLVWLAARHESNEIQTSLEREAASAISDLRYALDRNQQSLEVLGMGAAPLALWQNQATVLLRGSRSLVRIEARDSQMGLLAQAQSPYHPIDWEPSARLDPHGAMAQACANARRQGMPAYGGSYFQPYSSGQGAELLELCLPQVVAGQVQGFTVATYALQDMLADTVSHSLAGNQEVSFTDPDGTRLAVVGAAKRGARLFSTQQLLTLSGASLVLRMDSWQSAPQLFPNLLTALVAAMGLALSAVVLLLVRDNRRRLRAEQGLGEALAFRQAMEDSLVAGLRARDLQGRTTYVNQAFCAMVGYSAQELIGHDGPAPYWPQEQAQRYYRRLQEPLRARSLQEAREGFSAQYQHRDGRRLEVLIFETPLRNAQGQQQGWMSAILDVSEQRQMQEQSRAAQERMQAQAHLATLGEMASLLSHELNQPLAVIASYATGSLNLLAHEPPPDDCTALRQQLQDLHGAMQRIADQASRAGRVMLGVRNLVRQRGQARERVSAADLLGVVLPLIHLQARAGEVHLVSSVAPGLAPVLCQRTMVEQVLLNLARNAIQAMESVPAAQRQLQIQVRAMPREDMLEFAVCDSGPGIAPEVAAQLFTPFFTTRAQGMGLGLNLCRTVVEQHGGTIAFTARQPQGSIFTFTLPTGGELPPSNE